MDPARRLGISRSELRRRLARLSGSLDGRFLDTDPVGIVRRFHDPADREVVALLAAALAYGNVRAIRGSLERLLAILGPRPGRFVASFDPGRDPRRFEGFAHRFTRGRDVALLLWLVRQACESRGSLGRFFSEGDADPDSATLERAMDSFGERLFALDPRPVRPARRLESADPVRWLLPVPRGRSLCKRHCLFLRWMIRPDDGVDLGIWGWVDPSRLVVPLDVHVQRVAGVLGWTRRKSPGWPMALEVTSCLRALDPADPARYDFALSRLGILGLLRAREGRLSAPRLLEVLDHACENPPILPRPR